MRKYIPIPEPTDKQRRNFSLQIDKRGPDDCWEWLAGRGNGRGRFYLYPDCFYATRVMYYLATGVQPRELCVCHTCDNPSCVNPDHLFLGTDADNTADKIAKGRERGPRGEAHARAVLTERDVLTIRRSHKTQVELAAEYGVRPPAISKIILRKSWKHI
jgi:hypothetical protein